MAEFIILTYDYPPNNGGIARLCFEIKRQYQKHNMPVKVISVNSGEKDLENDRNVIRINGKRIIVEWRVWNYLRKNVSKDAIILTGTFHPDGLLALLSGKKFYILAHGAELLPGNSFFRKHIWKLYRKWVLQKAECVIANSTYTANLVRNCSPKVNVKALPLAVDTTYFYPTSTKKAVDTLSLCSISRLEQFKGHDFIIKTINKLPEKYRNKIHLNIGGKGKYKPVLESMVNQLGLSKQITFSGFIEDNLLKEFYSKANGFILCTREEPQNQNVEGFGLVFTEAQACGTAVIGTNAGGIPDAIQPGYGGWLINQDDENQLSQLLIHLLEHPDELEVQGKKARERVEKEHTWETYFNTLNRILQ